MQGARREAREVGESRVGVGRSGEYRIDIRPIRVVRPDAHCWEAKDTRVARPGGVSDQPARLKPTGGKRMSTTRLNRPLVRNRTCQKPFTRLKPSTRLKWSLSESVH